MDFTVSDCAYLVVEKNELRNSNDHHRIQIESQHVNIFVIPERQNKDVAINTRGSGASR